MPNAGKSSLFNALTRAGAQAANYPFTTVEPNVAVVGVHSERWGETPVAFVVARRGTRLSPEDIMGWANAQLGKVQRISDVRLVDELPRSPIGKVLKRELRDAYRPREVSGSGT